MDLRIVTLTNPKTVSVKNDAASAGRNKVSDVLIVVLSLWLGLFLGILIGISALAANAAPAPIVDAEVRQAENVETTAPADELIQTAPEAYACTNPEKAHAWDTETVEALAKTVWGEARGCSTTEQAAVIWCILNRADSAEPYYPDDPLQVVQQTGQFDGYDPNNPVDPALVSLTEDVLDRWELEKLVGGDVGRVLPADYLFFEGDGVENHFRHNYIKDGTTWDWSLESPYEE